METLPGKVLLCTGMKYPRSRKTGINPQQEKFCEEYLKNGKNGAAAARAAGAKEPRTYAYRNLKRPEVLAYLETLKEGARETVKRRFSYTVEDSFDRLVSIQEKAIADKQYAPAIKAEEIKAKLAGFFDDEQQGKPQDITITVKTSADLKAKAKAGKK